MKKKLSISANRDETEKYLEVSKILLRETGIKINDDKISLLKSRLSRRIKDLGLENISHYLPLIKGHHANTELPHLISALTTNFTNFFREAHHFDYLKEKALPTLVHKPVIRVWSAGCSTGQEPISIALTALELGDALSQKVKILATDIDHTAIKKAKSFTYTSAEVENISSEKLTRHFDNKNSTYTAKENIRSMIDYNVLNLNSTWSASLKFDIIFCRNVVIYFDRDKQNELWKNFSAKLNTGGWLLIGHSERIAEQSSLYLEPMGSTSYRKTS